MQKSLEKPSVKQTSRPHPEPSLKCKQKQVFLRGPHIHLKMSQVWNLSPREVWVEAGKSHMNNRALSGSHSKKRRHGMAHRKSSFTGQGPPLGKAVPYDGHRGPREGRPHCFNSKLRFGVPSARSPGSTTQLPGLGGKGVSPL